MPVSNLQSIDSLHEKGDISESGRRTAMRALRADQFSFILRFAITEFRGMYVCICKSVSNHEIKDAVERGDVTSLSCLRKCLGVGTGCGICLESAKECLSDALARNLPCDAMAQYESPAEIRIGAALA